MTRNPTAGYIAPFAVFIGLMAVERLTGLSAAWLLPFRFAVVLAVILLFSRPYLSLRPRAALATLALGTAVFFLWIGPDALFHYRHFWLFENAITGAADSSLSPALRHQPAFLALRVAISVLLVPILEELFWRGWLMRWLIDRDWTKVPLGTYNRSAFWIVALLFASEHGPYWEVGLIAGIAYNWWMIRTKSLADCILAHAVTNGILAAYVIAFGQWQYWL
jgi:CAAX prenyl protease-like protein